MTIDTSPQKWNQIQVPFPPFSAGDPATLTPLRPKSCNSNPLQAGKVPKYLLPKDLKKFRGDFGVTKSPLCIQNVTFHCRFKKKIFEKNTNNFSKPLFRNFRFLLHFYETIYPKIHCQFSKYTITRREQRATLEGTGL